MQPEWTLPSRPHRSLHLPIHIPTRDRMPLVELFAPTRKRDLQFCSMSSDIHAKWHQRQASSFDFTLEIFNLFRMEEEFSRPRRIVVIDVALGIRRDVQAVDPYLSILDPRKRFLKRNPSAPNRLDLRTS